MRRALLLLALLAAATARGGDDVGDSAAAATALSASGAAVNHAIDTDTDDDWFTFSLPPWVATTLTISTGTVWDCDARVFAPDAATLLAVTNTIGGSPAQIVFQNNGPASLRYLQLKGLLEFTTGTYAVALSTNIVDTDGDTLPDSWETNYFGSLGQSAGADPDGDGFINGQEYVAGTHPSNSASRLAATALATGAGATAVTWPAVSNGYYLLYRTTALGTGADWQVAGSLYHTAPTNRATFIDTAAPATTRFYRVGLPY